MMLPKPNWFSAPLLSCQATDSEVEEAITEGSYDVSLRQYRSRRFKDGYTFE